MPVTITLHDGLARQLEQQAGLRNVSLEQWAVEILLRQSEKAAVQPKEGQEQLDEVAPFDLEQKANVCHARQVRPDEFDAILKELRGWWNQLVDAPRSQRTALAVLHGLAERSVGLDLPRQAFSFFWRHLGLFEQEDLRADEVENEAARLGLPVCDTEESVEALAGSFGYVDTVEEQQARVVLLDEQDQNAIADLWVPIGWLPRAYREEGAGVAWVQRKYRSGVKGRFEPASAGD